MVFDGLLFVGAICCFGDDYYDHVVFEKEDMMSIKQTMERKLSHPGVPSIAVFFSTLFVAISSWGVQHQDHGHIFSWLELFDPVHFFSLLGVFGSVLGAWLAKSPLKE